jgi:uncharacterized lipoprotein YmbA
MSTSGPSRAFFVVAALAALVFAGACGSSPASRFYTLSAAEAGPARATPAGAAVISIGPVAIPEYLDRPQIATRTTPNEIALAEYERWAGSFGENVEMVLAENLTAALRGPGIKVLRWGAAGLRSVPIRCRIGVDIFQFDAAADGQVLLKARWTIFDAGPGRPGTVGETTVTEPAGAADHGSIVAAMSRALAAMSRDIAAGLVAGSFVP